MGGHTVILIHKVYHQSKLLLYKKQNIIVVLNLMQVTGKQFLCL